MSATTSIHDETDLPAPPTGAWFYIRPRGAPARLIHPFSGDAFVRDDGQVWEWGAYVVRRQERGGAVTCKGEPAYADGGRMMGSAEVPA